MRNSIHRYDTEWLSALFRGTSCSKCSTEYYGERVMALIMNVLTEGEPLYRLPEFFEATDTENLFHDGIEPDNLNDDALGRGLDQLAETGLRTVLGTVMWEAASRETHSPRVVHSDTTTVSVQGDYETDDESDQALNITYGHSKDNRGDLKQYTVGLGVDQHGVPVVGDILDGNASDKTWNVDVIENLSRWVNTDELAAYVGDCKVVSKETFEAADEFDIELISRLARTYNLTNDMIETALDEDNWTDLGAFSEDDDAATYQTQSFPGTLYEQDVQCVVVRSSSLKEQAENRIEQDLESTEEDLSDAVDQLADRSFACEEDAVEAAAEWLADHDEDCFEIETDVVETEEKKSRDSPGRPPKDWDPYKTVYKVAVTVQRDEQVIKTRKEHKSCFVLVTTLTDTEEWTGEEILELYKDQQTVERRFPVLKDPKRVGPVFLNRPDRVEALGYVLILALLIYSLIEQRARRALATAEEPMKLAGGPKTRRPTGRRVLERFENMVVIVDDDGQRIIPANVDVPERVLELLDLSVEVYGVEDE
ncbi:IS1634 family transposase [Halovenus salina]|uniref:IS1634 family transposase n=1 Tax=Halovenus salina TaxID=1510225 RepID=UPI003F5EF58B